MFFVCFCLFMHMVLGNSVSVLIVHVRCALHHIPREKHLDPILGFAPLLLTKSLQTAVNHRTLLFAKLVYNNTILCST